MSPAVATLSAALAAVPGIADLARDEAGAWTFRWGRLICSLQSAPVADGLDVASLTCVLAIDLPAGPARAHAEQARAAATFGAVRIVDRDETVDALVQYPFPHTGLSAAALTTMLTLALSGADQARTALEETGP